MAKVKNPTRSLIGKSSAKKKPAPKGTGQYIAFDTKTDESVVCRSAAHAARYAKSRNKALKQADRWQAALDAPDGFTMLDLDIRYPETAEDRKH